MNERSRHVAVSTWGRFHMFHLARQLEQRGWLDAVFTTYPRFKLRDEKGVPAGKIHCDWPVETAMIGASRFGIPVDRLIALDRLKIWQHDLWLASRIGRYDAFIALSGTGGKAGPIIQARGGRWLCDRGSTHHRWQIRTIGEEFARWGLAMPTAWSARTERECEEYAGADRVVVPSDFVKNTFVEEGVSAEKVEIVPYGANLARFRPAGAPSPDDFTILFVGQFGLRKGAPYLLDAFARFRHPRKRLKIIGAVQPEMRELLPKFDLSHVEFLGTVPNAELAGHYSRAQIFALPSIEEGLAMVLGESLACGTPVIATENTGASNLFTNGSEGFIIPARDVEALLQRFERFASEPSLRPTMSAAALHRVASIGGWDTYGASYAALLDTLAGGGKALAS